MAHDGDDITGSDGELVAPVIPLRHRQDGQAAGEVLADEPAGTAGAAEDRSEPMERSVWDQPTATLRRRERPQSGSPATPTGATVGRGERRWVARGVAVVAAAGVLGLALILGVHTGLTGRGAQRVGSRGLHAGAPSPAIGPAVRRLSPSHRSASRHAARGRGRRALPAAHSGSAPSRLGAGSPSASAPTVAGAPSGSSPTQPASQSVPAATSSGATAPVSSGGAGASREFGFEQ
jgi:hypothetical protein